MKKKIIIFGMSMMLCLLCGCLESTPLTDAEMASLGIQKEVDMDYEIGDTIQVVAGAWADTVGVIQSMNMQRQSLTINVELFGRETPVEISFAEVKKL